MAVYMHVIDIISIVITLASYLPFTEIPQLYQDIVVYCFLST